MFVFLHYDAAYKQIIHKVSSSWKRMTVNTKKQVDRSQFAKVYSGSGPGAEEKQRLVPAEAAGPGTGSFSPRPGR